MSPTVTFVLVSYNQQETAAEAARHALNQVYPNLEIVISDDCSTDETFARLRRVCAEYEGPHEVKLIKTRTNLGLVGNLCNAVAAATGGLAIIAAADDLSHPNRASELVRAWVKAGAPRSAVVYSNVRPVDRDGQIVRTWSERVARPPFTVERLAGGGAGPLGAACAITPNLLYEPQPIDSSVRHEDRVFPFRAALLGGPILFVDKPLVDYRVEGGVSRSNGGDRWHYLTIFAASHIARVLSDARQRLSDAKAARAPKHIVKRCGQVLAEQQAFLEMADGRGLIGKGYRAILRGARPSVIAIHLARFARAALH
ncbi:MAG: glycosyltransferase family 2 protein [Sphingomicrobium sp.]